MTLNNLTYQIFVVLWYLYVISILFPSHCGVGEAYPAAHPLFISLVFKYIEDIVRAKEIIYFSGQPAN